MEDQVLALSIGGERIAVPLARVQSLVEVREITPAPRAPAHILGLTAIRSQALTVIDPYVALQLGDTDRRDANAAAWQALVVEYDRCRYALLIDSIDGVTDTVGEPAVVNAPMQPGWKHAGIGQIETADGVMLLVDPAAIIAGMADNSAHGDSLQNNSTAPRRTKDTAKDSA